MFVIKRMIFQENDSKLIFELKDINMQDQGFMPFSKTIQGLMNIRIFIFRRKKRLLCKGGAKKEIKIERTEYNLCVVMQIIV